MKRKRLKKRKLTTGQSWCVRDFVRNFDRREAMRIIKSKARE